MKFALTALALSLALATVSGCASSRVSLEGLRPRAAEAIDPRVPLPTEAVGKPADTSLSGQISAAEARAAAGAQQFDALLPSARSAASARSPTPTAASATGTPGSRPTPAGTWCST